MTFCVGKAKLKQSKPNESRPSVISLKQMPFALDQAKLNRRKLNEIQPVVNKYKIGCFNDPA